MRTTEGASRGESAKGRQVAMVCDICGESYRSKRQHLGESWWHTLRVRILQGQQEARP